jgi:hypothetical protein
MREPDYIEQGMIEAEKDNGFSVVRGGAMSPDSVYAQYRSLQNRAPVPYVAPKNPVQVPQSEVVFSVEMKRFTIGVSVVTVCGIVLSNGALIAGIIAEAVAPVVAVAVGVIAACIAVSSFRGGGGTTVKAGAKQETHIHYHQYNYSGNGEQKNA